MKSMWFKSEFVVPILSGEKTDTMRRKSGRLPKVGDVVNFSVGPRTPFASAHVESLEEVSISSLSEERKSQVVKCYGDVNELVRIKFKLSAPPCGKRA